MIPKTPNEQSTSRQKRGMPRIGPQINARGTTIRQAIMPNSTTQIFHGDSLDFSAVILAARAYSNQGIAIRADH
jgi:hypothetical protein